MTKEQTETWNTMVEAATGNFLPSCEAVCAVDLKMDRLQLEIQAYEDFASTIAWALHDLGKIDFDFEEKINQTYGELMAQLKTIASQSGITKNES